MRILIIVLIMSTLQACNTAQSINIVETSDEHPLLQNDGGKVVSNGVILYKIPLRPTLVRIPLEYDYD